MKRLFLLISAALLGSSALMAQQVAFPGAEGFGKYALGARGVTSPTVYHVTNLNDAGAGSFRDAVSAPGRIVVFDTCGVINLKSTVVFSGNSYIAGQTAPGDGIMLYGNRVSFSGASNLIVRHLRIYMGMQGQADADASGLSNGTDMMFDHLSIAWGKDETFSVSWDNKGTAPGNITIQNSIIGQGLMTHSAGGLIQTDGGVSILGCLYIDNSTRNPKAKGLTQYINNVVYNWQGNDGFILSDSEGDSWFWIEGNYFVGGPNSSSSPYTRARNIQFYFGEQGNYVDANKDGTLNGAKSAQADYERGAGDATTLTYHSSLEQYTGLPKPFVAPSTILTPQAALEKVVASVGASLPARSAVDAYMVDELLSYGKKGKLITREEQNGIYNNVGIINIGPRPLDSDNDGIPDAWEEANGLNKNSAADALLKAANGYLNIENYINSISAPVSEYLRAPSNIQMTERTKESVRLEWTNNSTLCDALMLQYSLDGITWNDVQTLEPTATHCNLACLSEETPYYYRLIAMKSGMPNSTPSEVIRTVTEGEPKAPYQSIAPSPAVGATSRFYTSVDFAWQNETGPWAGAVAYDVYFGASEAALAKVNTAPLTAPAYTYTPATPLTMGSTYYWRVDATNTLGTTAGTVWSFKAGTYSFTSTYVDIGSDWVNGGVQQAQSGVAITQTTQTLNDNTNNEVKLTVTGGSAGKGDNVWVNKGYTPQIPFWKLAANQYLDVELTEASTVKNIASVVLNGAGDNVDSIKGSVHAVVLFSDKTPFDGSSIIGYEQCDLIYARKPATNVKMAAAVGTKSFRVYTHGVTISTIGENLYAIGSAGANPEKMGGCGANACIAYVGATLELLSNDGGGTTPPVLSSNNNLSAITINGATATVDQTAGTASVNFPKSAGALGSWVVTFSLPAGATASFTSGSTHNFANGALTIEVTAENGDKKTYTLTATVSDKLTVGILTKDGAADPDDTKLNSAFADYTITYINAGGTQPSNIADLYQGVDLIVLHSNVTGTNPIAVATKAMVGVKPILNLKAYFYSNNRWNWGTPANGAAGDQTVTVATEVQNHPIFAGVTFESDGTTLTCYASPTTAQNGIQSITDFNGTEWSAVSAKSNVLAKHGNNTQMHEVNLSNAAKYLLVAFSFEEGSYNLFSDATVTLLKNAAAYLLDAKTHYDYATHAVVTESAEEAYDVAPGVPCVVGEYVPSANDTLTEMTINGAPTTIDQAAGTISCTMFPHIHAAGTWVVTYTLADDKATASFASGDTHNFATPFSITVTAENGHTKTYIATVTITPASANNRIATLSVNGVAAQIDNEAATITCNLPEKKLGFWTVELTLEDSTATADLRSGDGIDFESLKNAAGDAATLDIVATAENGDVKVYTLTVTVSPQTETGVDATLLKGIYYAAGLLHNPRGLSITLYNALGTALLTDDATAISVAHLPQGVYLARVKGAGAVKFAK